KRIEFHEITSDAVRRALESPREIDMRLVNAQQARRVVDRLVGFGLSPFLWSKVQKGIGAGRVSSVALRLVVDREEEIRKFVPVESWTIDAELSKEAAAEHFLARLNRAAGTPAAHEAVRPTDVNRTPDSIREHLTPEQFKLYDLIWRRFVASRMAPAVYDQTQVEIEGAAYIFRATGSVLAFDGFYAVWPREEENGAQDLPAVADGEALEFYGLKPEQHFSRPP